MFPAKSSQLSVCTGRQGETGNPAPYRHVFAFTPFSSEWANGCSSAATCKQHPKTSSCHKPPTQRDAGGSLLSGAVPLPCKCLLPQKSLLPTIVCSQIFCPRLQHPEPAQRKQPPAEEAVSRALWESLSHMLPLAVVLYPPSGARPLLTVPKTTCLEADASFKQALGAAAGVPRLLCQALGSTGDWWRGLHGWQVLASTLLTHSQVQLYQLPQGDMGRERQLAVS